MSHILNSETITKLSDFGEFCETLNFKRLYGNLRKEELNFFYVS